MDPGNGALYGSVEAAHLAGVWNPVEMVGRPEDVERISLAVGERWTREQKDARNVKNRAARTARRVNR